MKKILILMAKFGGGHESIALGIKEAIDKFGKNEFLVEVVDGFPKIFTDHQEYGSFPFIAEQSYKFTNFDRISKILHEAVTVLIGRYLKKIIIKHSPDLIISDHPLLTSEIKGVLGKIKKKIKFAIYFADAIYPHHLWFTEKNADLYFAPTRECFVYAEKLKIPREKLVYTGWILREKYYQANFDKNECKKNLGLNQEKFLVVLSGGGEGVGKIDEIVDLLLKNKYFRSNGQLVVVCGTNHKLLIKMQKLQRRVGDLLNSFGFIHNFSDYKKAADLVCSKAGPNDIFESILLEKPFFAHNYLWAHEIDNMKWVKHRGIGFAERNPKKMVSQILRVMKTPSLLQENIARTHELRSDHTKVRETLMAEIKKILC